MTGRGAQPTLVFLPGSLCDERLFAHQVDELGALFRTTVANVTGSTSIKEMADRVLESTPGPLIPVGLSMGGIVAAELIDRTPDRVPAAVLLDTNLGLPGAEQLKSRRRWASQTRAGQFADVVNEIVPSLTADLAAGGGLAAEMALAAGPLRFLDENEALSHRGHDRRPNVARFRGPLLVIVGEYDRLCPPSLHRDLVETADRGHLVVVPGAGHLSTIDRPEAVTEAMRTWLADLKQAAAQP